MIFAICYCVNVKAEVTVFVRLQCSLLDVKTFLSSLWIYVISRRVVRIHASCPLRVLIFIV